MYANGLRWMRRAHKPPPKEIQKVSKTIAVGVALLGGAGVLVRLLMGLMLRSSYK